MGTITNEMKKLMLAGIGAVVESKEFSERILNELAEKGADTLRQGKALNEELKRNIQKTLQDDAESDVKEAVGKMDADQLASLKAYIAELEKKQAPQVDEDE